jgi:hypothetical protein
MAGATEKEEVRKRRSIYGAPPWNLMSVAPGTEARFRRWNVILIAILVFFVLGVFVVAKAPKPVSKASSPANVSLKVG